MMHVSQAGVLSTLPQHGLDRGRGQNGMSSEGGGEERGEGPGSVRLRCPTALSDCAVRLRCPTALSLALARFY